MRSSSSSIAAPTRIRSSPACQVFCRTPSRWYGARDVGVEPPAHAGPAHPVAGQLQGVVVEAEPLPHRRHRREVQHLGRREPGVGQLEEPRDDGQHRVGLAQRPVGEPHPQPVPRVHVDVVEAPVMSAVEVAEHRRDERRVGLDVRAHHDDVAQLEGRVVVEHPEQQLAQHLDLALPPVARVHLQRPVAGGEPRRRRRDGPRGGRAAAGRAACRPVEAVEPGCRACRDPAGARPRPVEPVGPPSRTCSSRASRPQDRSNGCRGTSTVGSSRRATTSASAPASRSQSTWEGCGSQRCTSRCSASASSTCSCSVVSRVGPKTDSRAGSSTIPGSRRSRAHAGSSRCAGLSDPISARTRRQSSACQVRSSSSGRPWPSVSRPAAQSRSMAGRCAPYPENSAASFWAVATRRPPVPAGRRAGRGAARGWRTTARCRTARSRRAAPRSAGARPTGRRGGRRRCPRVSASATTRAGDGNATLAQMPSPAPVPERGRRGSG